MTNKQKPQLSSLPSTAKVSYDALPSSMDPAMSKAPEQQKRGEMFGRGESPAPPSGLPSHERQLRTDTWGRSAAVPAAPPSAPAGSVSSLRNGSKADPQQPAGARRTRGG